MQFLHDIAKDKNLLRLVFAIFWSVFAAGYIYGITFIDIPENSLRHADTVLGFVLGTIVATIIAYYFGSSQGSSDKNDIINQSQNRL
jgi:uncharacterized PurR-regulated membrane protein YhhQ (DUF165 family)